MWFVSIFVLAVAVAAFLSAKLSARTAESKYAAQALRLLARMRYQQAALNSYAVVEELSCGWLNLLLKFLWPGFLSNIVTNLVWRQLHNLFERLSRNLSQQPIFRCIFANLQLRELSLGSMAPRLSHATARVHPEERALELEFDLDWTTCGSIVDVDTVATIGGRVWPVKLHGSEIIIEGRVLLIVYFSRTVLPGISGIQFSFIGKPQLHFDISTSGLAVSELPGLLNELRKRLTNIIANEAVEPSRVFINPVQPFYNLVTRKQSGAAGQLRVKVSHATDLKAALPRGGREAMSEGSSSGVGDCEQIMCFVEVVFNGRILVSPVSPQTSMPRWDWTFYLPIDTPPSEEGTPLRIRVRNVFARSVAQPQVCGEGEIALMTYPWPEPSYMAAAEGGAPTEGVEARVRLKVPKGGRGGGGVLHLTLTHEREPQEMTHAAQQDQQVVPLGQRRPHDGDMSGSVVMRVEGDESSLQGEWSRHCAKLKKMLYAEVQRRKAQELRALLEGAPFILHRDTDTYQRLVWLAAEKGTSFVRWESLKGYRWGLGRRKPSLQKLHYHELPCDRIFMVHSGHQLFPEMTPVVRSQLKNVTLNANRCFTLGAKIKRSNGVGEDHILCLHLEVPPGGNGRSRAEWVSAFTSLQAGELEVHSTENAVQH